MIDIYYSWFIRIVHKYPMMNLEPLTLLLVSNPHLAPERRLSVASMPEEKSQKNMSPTCRRWSSNMTCGGNPEPVDVHYIYTSIYRFVKHTLITLHIMGYLLQLVQQP